MIGLVKLPAHRAGLPGKFFSFALCPSNPPIRRGLRGTFRSRFRRGDHPDPTAPETEGLLITSGFPLGEAIMADAFPQVPIFIGTRAENQRESLRDVDSTFFLLNFFLDMEGDDFTQKEIMAPQGKYFFNPTFH